MTRKKSSVERKTVPGRVDIITMGCSKNLVDSERLMRLIEDKGYEVCFEPDDVAGEYAVINTCGFIGDAKEESIEMILKLAECKKHGKIGNLYVMGCLSERYLKELQKEIPEVDAWFGKFDWTGILDLLPQKTVASETGKSKSPRKLSTPPWTAYIKVSEGCNRFCAFCAIPHITGRHTSRPMEEILDEVRLLAKEGVKEFNIIAQDLSSYGEDLYGKQMLAPLIDSMAQIEGVEWIRLHYLYPAGFPLDILDVMAKHENVCNYLDLALQHISDDVLANMNRKINRQQTLALLDEIKRKVPGVTIRTTIMTGFPGEGEKEFEELKEFVESQKFGRLGGFSYSEEEGTLGAAKFDDNIPIEVKERRLAQIMRIQERISLEANLSLVGKTVKVLVEENDGNDAIGRTESDSPEVDQTVVIKNCNAAPGSFVEAVVTGAGEFDLEAEIKQE